MLAVKTVKTGKRHALPAQLAFCSLGAGIVALAAAPTHGALLLTVSEPGFATQTGVVTGNTDVFTGTIGDFMTSVVFGVTNSAAPASQGLLQITSLNVVSIAPVTSGAKTLTITLSDNGFTGPGTAGQILQLDSSLGGTVTSPAAVTGDSVRFQATATPNGGAAVTNGLQTFAVPPTVGSQTVSIPGGTANFTATTGYTVLEQVVVTLSSPAESATLSGSATVNAAPVPEPVGLSVVALAGTALLARRRTPSAAR